MIIGITWTHLESVWNPSGSSKVPTPQTNNWSGTFFHGSYSKPALVHWNSLEKEDDSSSAITLIGVPAYVSNTLIYFEWKVLMFGWVILEAIVIQEIM